MINNIPPNLRRLPLPFFRVEGREPRVLLLLAQFLSVRSEGLGRQVELGETAHDAAILIHERFDLLDLAQHDLPLYLSDSRHIHHGQDSR